MNTSFKRSLWMLLIGAVFLCSVAYCCYGLFVTIRAVADYVTSDIFRGNVEQGYGWYEWGLVLTGFGWLSCAMEIILACTLGMALIRLRRGTWILKRAGVGAALWAAGKIIYGMPFFPWYPFLLLLAVFLCALLQERILRAPEWAGQEGLLFPYVAKLRQGYRDWMNEDDP